MQCKELGIIYLTLVLPSIVLLAFWSLCGCRIWFLVCCYLSMMSRYWCGGAKTGNHGIHNLLRFSLLLKLALQRIWTIQVCLRENVVTFIWYPIYDYRTLNENNHDKSAYQSWPWVYYWSFFWMLNLPLHASSWVADLQLSMHKALTLKLEET